MRANILILVAVAVTAIGCGCNSSSNRLIGTWVSTDNGCPTPTVFASDTWKSHVPASHDGSKAYDVASQVTYQVSQSDPNVIAVNAQSGTQTWQLTDANHVTSGPCNYTRQ